MGLTKASVPLTIAAQHIFDGTTMRGPGSVTISEGRIDNISFGEPEARAAIQLPPDAILAPGFIDIQVNGGGGVLLNDQPTEAGVRRIVEAHRKGGTTGCLPTSSPIAARSCSDWLRSPRLVLEFPACSGFIWKGRPSTSLARAFTRNPQYDCPIGAMSPSSRLLEAVAVPW